MNTFHSVRIKCLFSFPYTSICVLTTTRLCKFIQHYQNKPTTRVFPAKVTSRPPLFWAPRAHECVNFSANKKDYSLSLFARYLFHFICVVQRLRSAHFRQEFALERKCSLRGSSGGGSEVRAAVCSVHVIIVILAVWWFTDGGQPGISPVTSADTNGSQATRYSCASVSR